MLMFVESAEFNETVTIERALRCVELSKDILDEVGNARAQCFAGCVLTELGRTKENARKSARLIKPALRVLKKMDDSFAKAVVPVGEGYIANCHFMNEEYDLALEWYESALKGLQSCNDLTRNSFSGYFSMRIVECEMRKR
ncbi:MAG: hypothetical protein LBT59_26560 [Clostridiales bacterium]|nr:hypothetical protein [Clostridiales bacterium]